MATTAQVLVTFHKELLAGEIPDQLANDMVRDAAARIVQRDGLTTKLDLGTDDPPSNA